MDKKADESENTNEDSLRVTEDSSSQKEEEEVGIIQTFWTAIVTFFLSFRPTVYAVDLTRRYRSVLAMRPDDVQVFDVKDSVAIHGEDENCPSEMSKNRRGSVQKAPSQIHNASLTEAASKRKSSNASSRDLKDRSGDASSSGPSLRGAVGAEAPGPGRSEEGVPDSKIENSVNIKKEKKERKKKRALNL